MSSPLYYGSPEYPYSYYNSIYYPVNSYPADQYSSYYGYNYNPYYSYSPHSYGGYYPSYGNYYSPYNGDIYYHAAQYQPSGPIPGWPFNNVNSWEDFWNGISGALPAIPNPLDTCRELARFSPDAYAYVSQPPDYFAFEESVGVLGLSVVIVPKTGHRFIGGGGGLSFPTAGAMVVFGWLVTDAFGFPIPPGSAQPEEIDNFAAGWGITYGGGFVIGLNRAQSAGSGTAVECGAATPQFGFGGGFTFGPFPY